MKKTLTTILVTLVVSLCVGIAGIFGFLWYRDSHIFVENTAYPKNAQSLDLRDKDISFAHFDDVQSQLPGCEILWNVPFQGGRLPSGSRDVTVSSLTMEDAAILVGYFPELATVDATGCSDYEVLEVLQHNLLNAEVHYTVSLGAGSVAPDVTELYLPSDMYTWDGLRENLRYLPQLTALELPKTELAYAQIRELRDVYPEIEISCTVELLGREYGEDTTQLDLSGMEAAQMEDFVRKLPMLPNLETVDLMGGQSASALTKEDVKRLQEAAPNVVFDYSFDFYGETLSTADEEVHIVSKRIGDEGESEVRAALDIMTNCKRFVLEYCGLSNDVLARIREDYRDRTKVVWRVFFGGGSTLTDAEAIRCTYDLVDDNCHDLVYCEDVRFVDFGHNEFLDGYDFVSGMVNLEYIILSGSPIKSLEPFRNCKKLKLLEIAFCEYITDLTPLAECVSLEKLNISNTHATDLSPLDGLPLTHLMARHNPSGVSRVPVEEQERFAAQHPDCWARFSGEQPYGVGWRYDTDKVTPLPHYADMIAAFRYPHAPNNTGWYLTE